MANLQKIIIVLLIITLILSATSVVFNIMIFKMKPQTPATSPFNQIFSSNSGNIGLFVEGGNSGGANG